MSSADLATIAAGVAATIQLLRLSIDLISVATKVDLIGGKDKTKTSGNDNGSQSTDNQSTDKNKSKEAMPLLSKSNTYGSVGKDAEEAQPPPFTKSTTTADRLVAKLSLILHGLWTSYFCLACLFCYLHNENNGNDGAGDVVVYRYGAVPLGVTATVLFQGFLLAARDISRERFGLVQRVLSVSSSLVLTAGAGTYLWTAAAATTTTTAAAAWSVVDRITLSMIVAYFVWSLVECKFLSHPNYSEQPTDHKPTLSRHAIYVLLKPYVWPDATSRSAALNRTLAILTWVFVITSKIANLVSPILLGWASTALSQQKYLLTVKYSCAYAAISFLASLLKEGQSLVYLKVAQAASVQLHQVVFHHLHSLSLDWHLRKKLGVVLRSMDRGIAACDTLMKYLFLWLVPAMLECIVVCLIFATYFHYLPIAISVFYFVFIYIVWTILVTLWRKKYRKAVVKSDNDWHDKCTDSLVNYETVKYFTAEPYEMKRYGDAVKAYQSGSVNVQASLSFLNISQKIILTLCLGSSLSLAALGIQKRTDCCLEHDGCDSGFDECCTLLTDSGVCSGMEVGDFVAVLTYTLQLFSPLNFLGSVYNAVVMAIIDLTNLSELLAAQPDVCDAPDAIALPSYSGITSAADTRTTTLSSQQQPAYDPSIAVEFDNVFFHYPTQPSTKGLQGLSFTMKRGTTTAIVGPTGAGKTTISRLLFRFYDVLGGAVKVNGRDVRTVSQKSLRGAIGVVPQTGNMFNDTLRHNILYGRRDATQEDLDKVAEDAQLTRFISTLEEGWEALVGDRGLKLSGGELQRTAIARCLLKDPPFVVLDEATSALDTITENSVQEALDSLGSERTVLVIAHRLGTIRNADNIVVLKDGQVNEQGTHDELLEKNGLYAEMWNMQLHSSRNSFSSLSQLGPE